MLSDGTPWRPLIDVRDMARAIDWAIVREAERRRRVSRRQCRARTSETTRSSDLADAVAAPFPAQLSVSTTAAPPDQRSYKVDFSLCSDLAAERSISRRSRCVSRSDALRTGLRSMGFADKDFRNSPYMRLKMLERISRPAASAPDLRWRDDSAPQERLT